MRIIRTKSLGRWLLVGLCVLSGAPAARSADVVLQDDALVDYRIEQGGLTVRENDVTNVSPTVTFIEPGYVDFQTSVLDASTFLLVGGELHDRLIATDSATVTIAGGSISGIVTVEDNASLFMADGTLHNFLVARQNATATIAGGLVGGIDAQGNAVVTLAGGTITGPFPQWGLTVDEQAMIFISGTNFNYPFGPIADTAGTLTGVLASGEPILVPFGRFTDGQIVLVPEPSVTVMLITAAIIGIVQLRRPHRQMSCV